MRDDASSAGAELSERVLDSAFEHLLRVRAIRARGRARYVWRYVVLQRWVPGAALLSALLALLVPQRPPLLGAESVPAFAAWAAILLPAGAAAGYAWGRLLWGWFERCEFRALDRITGEPLPLSGR